jgi:hypothetical protein
MERRSWRERRRDVVTKKFVLILFAILMTFVIISFWKVEHDSCERSMGNREVIFEAIDKFGLEGQLHRPKDLDCMKLLPDH